MCKNIDNFYRNLCISANNPFMEYLHRYTKNIHFSNRILLLSAKIPNMEYLLPYAKYIQASNRKKLRISAKTPFSNILKTVSA